MGGDAVGGNAVADVAHMLSLSFYFLMGHLFAPKTAHPERFTANRAYPPPPIAWKSCASRGVGRLPVTSGRRGGGISQVSIKRGLVG